MSDQILTPPTYPDIADSSHATAAAAAFFRSFFTAKTSNEGGAAKRRCLPDPGETS